MGCFEFRQGPKASPDVAGHHGSILGSDDAYCAPRRRIHHRNRLPPQTGAMAALPAPRSCVLASGPHRSRPNLTPEGITGRDPCQMTHDAPHFSANTRLVPRRRPRRSCSDPQVQVDAGHHHRSRPAQSDAYCAPLRRNHRRNRFPPPTDAMAALPAPRSCVLASGPHRSRPNLMPEDITGRDPCQMTHNAPHFSANTRRAPGRHPRRSCSAPQVHVDAGRHQRSRPAPSDA